MADDHDARTYYLHRRMDTLQGDDQSPENPGAHLHQPMEQIPVIRISTVSGFHATTLSHALGKRQVIEVTLPVLKGLSAAELLDKCDDAESAGVTLQLRVMEDHDRD